MNDSFKTYSMKVFKELNENILKKFEKLESQQIEKNINNIFKIDEILTDTDSKLDKVINKMISQKLKKDILEELNYIN
jgi:hypothetical protein